MGGFTSKPGGSTLTDPRAATTGEVFQPGKRTLTEQLHPASPIQKSAALTPTSGTNGAAPNDEHERVASGEDRGASTPHPKGANATHGSEHAKAANATHGSEPASKARSRGDNTARGLGDYNSAVGKHVLVLREWDTTTIAARRVELQGRLSRTTDVKVREELVSEYEAIEWVARERNLALPKDSGEEAAPQAHSGGRPIKFWAPDNAQGMRAMLEREMAAGTGYADARDHAALRVDYSTQPGSAVDRDKRQIGDQQQALMDHDAAAFCAEFRIAAKHNALAMLSDSTVAIDTALQSYGIAGGDVRLSRAAHNVAKDPDALDVEVENWVGLSRKLDDNRGAFAAGQGRREELAHEAARLRALQDNIAELAAEQLRLLQQIGAKSHPRPAGTAQPKSLDENQLGSLASKHPQQSLPNPFAPASKPPPESPEKQLAFVQGALKARQAQFSAAWIQAEREHPVLAAYRGRKAADASTLVGIGDDDATIRSVLRHVLPKLGNIYRTRAALQGTWGTLDPMQLAPVVEISKRQMFVAEGSYRDRAVHDMAMEAHESHGNLVQWALEAVMIGLTLVTLIPTGGASVAAGLALTGLAYDVYTGLGDYEDFKLASAATDTNLDAIRSLSDTEPSLTPLLTRILSAGLNLTIAAGLFRRAVALRRAALSNAADREAVAALNKAGEEVGINGLADEALAELDIAGTAASSKVKFRPNPNHEVRKLSEALQIAERNGIDIDPDRFRFAITSDLPDNVGAQYFRLRESQQGQMIELKGLTDDQGRFMIRLNKNILDSDDKILGVIAHEVFEIDALEQAFIENGGRLEAKRIFALVDATQGTAHSAAWNYADTLVESLQKQGKHP